MVAAVAAATLADSLEPHNSDLKASTSRLRVTHMLLDYLLSVELAYWSAKGGSYELFA